jgi:glutathionylspermidine synthase
MPTLDYREYVATWQGVADAGFADLNLDVWAGGWRYLSLTAVCLSGPELRQLQDVVACFGPLLDRAVDGILADPDWWSALAWPWPALEMARQEPRHPRGRASLYGRFDCLLDLDGTWQVIEYNADTPSGGRESAGLEPTLARLQPDLHPTSRGLRQRLVTSLLSRIAAQPGPVHRVGIISSHSWLEDMAQATWLGHLLEAAGQPVVVGDINDLAQRGKHMTLRGSVIDALYRFYPVERLYRHASFAGLSEAVLDGQILLLNGLRGFLAQSKACLAWLWANRATLGAHAQAAIEQHLPMTVLARDPAAAALLPNAVVKHVNGREGDSVVFGAILDQLGWERRLLEGGYVVQQTVKSVPLEDVVVDDWAERVDVVAPRFACVGAFSIGGRFGGCYTRLDGPITRARATYAPTLVAGRAAVPAR